MEGTSIGVRYQEVVAKTDLDPDDSRNNVKDANAKPGLSLHGGPVGRKGDGARSDVGALRRRKVDKKMIGSPMDFRYSIIMCLVENS